MEPRLQKVYVAMSGGVDSSVAAALLKKRGFDVVGIFMKPWSPEATSYKLKALSLQPTTCLWRQDREDAMRAASVLDIPFETWDFSKQYKKSVTDYMVREYKAGRTPNPDVMCNKEIKFGLFFDRAMKGGADYIATGHYVRKVVSRKQQVARRGNKKTLLLTTYHKLLTAKDKNKDQSYFLWTLKQNQLKKCLFPIGEYTKPEVRRMAKKFGLPNHAKKDSQGVCFIGPLDMKDFLTGYIKQRRGKIISVGGRDIGTHDGVYYYTIGQRHGLNIETGEGPYYVVSKDVKKNVIYVGNEKDLFTKKTKVSKISWVNGDLKLPAKIDVRFRYRAELKGAVLTKNGELELKNPERAITEGQSAVFYRRGELLGGGIIV